MMLTRAASVEDLPQPAGPVSSTMPWWKLAKRARRRGQAEVVEGRRLRRDGAEDGVEAALLAVGVGAEAADAGDRVGEVDLAVLVEVALLLGRQDLADHGVGRPPASRGSASRSMICAVAPQLDRRAAVQVEVARPLAARRR